MKGALVNINSNDVINVSFNADLFTRWTDFIDASDKTVATYTRAIRQFLLFLKDNGIDQPNRESIKAFKKQMETIHKPTTAHCYLMAVKQFFKWTNSEGIYPNIAENIKTEKIDRAFKKDPLTVKEVKDLLNKIDRSSLKGKRDYAIILLMVTTGLRTIEVTRANIEDIRTVADFTALFIQGKGHKEKTAYVKLTDQTYTAIKEYLQARGKTDSRQPLFKSISNRNKSDRMTTRSVSRIAKVNMANAGIESERKTAHSLRHTTAVINLLSGASLIDTQVLLRHTNPNTTMIYSHDLERAKNNSEQRITDAIFN